MLCQKVDRNPRIRTRSTTGCKSNVCRWNSKAALYMYSMPLEGAYALIDLQLNYVHMLRTAEGNE